MPIVDEETDKSVNPYTGSILVQKLLENKQFGKPIRLAFLDIDVTFTSDLKIIASTKKRLEQLGYSIIFVTSRTEEMVMGKSDFEKSKKLGFSRPKPYIGMNKGKRVYKDPAKVYQLLVNPDVIIGSTGTQIVVRQPHGGFAPDILFDKQFRTTSAAWRKKTKRLLRNIDPQGTLITLPEFEYEDMYRKHEADVFPPKFRIKLICKSLEAKNDFIKKLKKEMKQENFFLRVTDDSNLHQNNYVIFLTPTKGFKGNAVNHMVKYVSQSLEIPKEKIEVILAGDSYPDLAMLFYGAKGTKTTGILVGGSPITNTLLNKEIHDYCGEDLSTFKENLQHQDGKAGFFSFYENIKKTYQRNIVIGDLAYPHTKGAATILAYLNS